ncbi:methyltransferase-like protein, partial [Dinothrombium tinctorium]
APSLATIVMRAAMDDSRDRTPRKLTEDERAKLSDDTALVSQFMQTKLEKDAKKNWDLFYKRNSTRFFKDRHWTTREFGELCGDHFASNRETRPKLLEIGAGVGNFIFPLIEENTNFYIYACDFSPVAVNLIKSNPLYNESTVCKAFVADITSDQFISDCRNHCSEGEVDVVSLIFVLSAINPEKMPAVVKNIFEVLKPGGIVIFRDYGIYDHAMLRFKNGHKLSENFYVRQDGTRAYYFSEDILSSLFENANFEILINRYVLRDTVNKKEGISVPRVFIQAKFMKPL